MGYIWTRIRSVLRDSNRIRSRTGPYPQHRLNGQSKNTYISVMRYVQFLKKSQSSGTFSTVTYQKIEKMDTEHQFITHSVS